MPFSLVDPTRTLSLGAGGIDWQNQAGWGWLRVSANLAIAAACFTFAVLLWRSFRLGRNAPSAKGVSLLAAIVAVCGLGFVLDALETRIPITKASGVLKFLLAGVAWAAVGAMRSLMPRALRLQSATEMEGRVRARTQELQVVNQRMKAEVARRQRTEASLREREGQLRLVLDSGRMGTWDWDLTTNLIRMDSRELTLFGLENHGGDTVPIERVFDAIHPDDRQRIKDATTRSIEEGASYTEEFRVRRGGDRMIWLGGRGEAVRDADGRPSRMIGVNFEITAQRKTDEVLLLRDRALQSATNGIVITDAQEMDLPIIYVNHAFETLTGYSAEEVLGRNCRFLQGPDTSDAAISEIRRALSEKASCHVVLRNYRKDGTPFWNELRITPLKAASGEISHFVGVQADVTDRKDFEETLKRAEARAQAASQTKSEFLANMSHEIRTPLTAVLGCADTLYPRLDREEHREMLQMIRNQGRILLGILNDILDLSKIEAGRLEIHRESCSIVSVIEEVRSLLFPQAAEKGLTLATIYETTMPSVIEADPLRLRQILINLVGNAIKFTDRGGVEILSRCHDGPAPALEIDVRDSGIGIPPDRLEAVFEAFLQVTSPASRRVGGTGLGLTISQRLVSMLNGRISVVSQSGEGSTFTVKLPVVSAEPLKFEAADGLTRAADAQHRSRDSVDIIVPATVLLAEDMRGIQFMIRRMLEDAGAMVAVVDNGERAVAEVMRSIASQRPFDVVLMDMQMPVMNGFDATARLRSLGVELPIVALTAAAMQGDREKCLEVGCNEYLAKPVDRYALLDVIARLYNRSTAASGTDSD